MVWHDDFTETIQADYVESVYTIAYSKPWLEAFTSGTSMVLVTMVSPVLIERRAKATTA
jgi:hypothetical protein